MFSVMYVALAVSSDSRRSYELFIEIYIHEKQTGLSL